MNLIYSRLGHEHIKGNVARQISIDEWLKFHDLGIEECNNYLHRKKSFPSIANTSTNYQTTPDLLPNEVWCEVSAAFERHFIFEGNDANAIILDIEPIFRKNEAHGDQAFTLDRNEHELPIVYVPCSTFCSPSDILAIAHEFAHAFQIISSRIFQNGRMPPIPRECCALIGELIYLSFLRDTKRKYFSNVLRAWWNNTQLYLRRYSRDLLKALFGEDCYYSYRLNYPLAVPATWILFEKKPQFVLDFMRSGSNSMDIFRELLNE